MGIQFQKDRFGVIVHEQKAIDFPVLQVPLRHNNHSLGSQASFNLFFSKFVTPVGVSGTIRISSRLGNVFTSFLVDVLAGDLAELVVNLADRCAIQGHTEIGLDRGRRICIHR